MRFTIYQESRTGKRPNNQDRIAYCYSRDALLMLVADGMGGHLHGELAAGLAAQHITRTFQREARPALPDPDQFLRDALLGAHEAILSYAQRRELPEVPRTTIVACVLQGGAAHWAHAGDSRLYLLRGGKLLARTRDHSRTQLLIERGELSPQAALNHPGRNRIYACLGGDVAPQLSLSGRTPLHDGDLIALCSDGVWSVLAEEDFLKGLGGPLDRRIPRLMNKAETLGGEHADNLSLIALCWHDENRLGQALPDSTSTLNMHGDQLTTHLDLDGTNVGEVEDLDADAIERHIRAIRNAIHNSDKRQD